MQGHGTTPSESRSRLLCALLCLGASQAYCVEGLHTPTGLSWQHDRAYAMEQYTEKRVLGRGSFGEVRCTAPSCRQTHSLTSTRRDELKQGSARGAKARLGFWPAAAAPSEAASGG